MPLIYPDCFQGDQDILNAFAAVRLRYDPAEPAAIPSQPLLDHSVPRRRASIQSQSRSPISTVSPPQHPFVPDSDSHASAPRQARVVAVNNSPSVPRHPSSASAITAAPERALVREQRNSISAGGSRSLVNDERPIPEASLSHASDRALVREQRNPTSADRSRPFVNDERPIPEASTSPVPQQVLHREGDPYNVVSGRRTGVRPTWADAGDATQGVPGGHVYKMQVTPPRRRRGRRCVAYVVFEGLAPGIYNTWPEAEALTKRIPGNVHQGFESRREAERAYIVAFALGALRVLPSRNAIAQQPLASAIPTPEAVMTAFAAASDTFLGAEWHVVFKGKRPGVYPAWNFVATQTKNVSCAIYKKYSTKAAAEEAFEEAVRDGFVQTL